MDLSKLPRTMVRYPFWEDRNKCYPLIPGPYPVLGQLQSRQGVLAISNFPTGAAINAIPAAPDRGLLQLQLNWRDAPAAWVDIIEIAVYMGGDAVNPLYVNTPTNAAAGRGSIEAALGDTAANVAVRFGNTCSFIMQSGGGLKWYQQNGRIFNDPQSQLNLICPRTAKAAEVSSGIGAVAAIVTNIVDASIVPMLYAGCRPGPQVVRGNRFAGYSVPHGEIG